MTDDSQEITDQPQEDSKEFNSGFGDDKTVNKELDDKEEQSTEKDSKPQKKENEDGTTSESKDKKAEKGSSDTEKPESGDAKKPEDADKGADKGGNKPGDAKKPEENLTAQQKLEKRASDGAADQLGLGKEEKKEPAKEGDKKAEKAEKKEKDAEKLPPISADMKSVLDLPDLVDADVQGPQGKIKLKEFAAEYPEVTESTIKIARAIAKQSVEELLKTNKFVTDKGMETLKADVDNVKFWNAVHSAHPDARKISSTDAFSTWLNKQSKLVQILGSSTDSEDGIAVLDAYKEHIAKTQKEGKDKDAGTKKEATDALHKDTVRGDKATKAEKSTKDKDDFDAGFKEGKE